MYEAESQVWQLTVFATAPLESACGTDSYDPTTPLKQHLQVREVGLQLDFRRQRGRRIRRRLHGMILEEIGELVERDAEGSCERRPIIVSASASQIRPTKPHRDAGRLYHSRRGYRRLFGSRRSPPSDGVPHPPFLRHPQYIVVRKASFRRDLHEFVDCGRRRQPLGNNLHDKVPVCDDSQNGSHAGASTGNILTPASLIRRAADCALSLGEIE